MPYAAVQPYAVVQPDRAVRSDATVQSDGAVSPPKKPRGEKPKRGPHIYARELPAHGFVRLETVLTIYPVGRSTWWKGIKDGRFPAAVKLGPRTSGWRVEDIRALIESGV
jgi:predicted DNA-binding transcriptional regulator AlpA